MKNFVCLLLSVVFASSLYAQARSAQPQPFTVASIQKHRDMRDQLLQLQQRFTRAFEQQDIKSMEAIKPEIVRLLDEMLEDMTRMHPALDKWTMAESGRGEAAIQRKQQKMRCVAQLSVQRTRIERMRNAFAQYQFSTLVQKRDRDRANLLYLREALESIDKVIALEQTVYDEQHNASSQRAGGRTIQGQ